MVVASYGTRVLWRSGPGVRGAWRRDLVSGRVVRDLVYLKIVNPGSQDVPGQLSFGGRSASAASIEALADPDPQAGNTLANPDAVVPARGTLRGSKGVFSYLVPANSLTVVRVAR